MGRATWIVSLCLFCTAAAEAADPVDLAKLERKKLDTLPKFTTEKPLYALAVFGAEAKTQVWFVLDKTKADAKNYDLLWADLNADGRFDADRERFETKSNRDLGIQVFGLGDFTDPATKDKHAELEVSIDLNRPICMIKLLWKGKAEHKLGGGYAPQGDAGYMIFAESASEAPLVWFNGDGPFRFQRWYSEKMQIGEEGDLKLFLGQEGVGKHTFCAFQRHVLPEGEPVLATLVYVDTKGKEQRQLYELKERC
jgi:hypothetical protein